MRTQNSAKHLYAFSFQDRGYVDLGPAKPWEQALAWFSAGKLTTNPPKSLIVKRQAQDSYEGPRSTDK